MNTMPNAEQFQAQLHQYVPVFTADAWPVWVMLAGMALMVMLGVLALHAFLRAVLAKKSVSAHEEKVYLYSKAIRFWHWSNAILFILLLCSGLFNHFGAVSASVMAIFVALHKICGFAFIACWFIFIGVNFFGGNGHHYIIKPNGFIGRSCKQVRFYLYGIIKGEDHPFPATQECKFNPLQQVAYIGIMFGLVPMLIITGLLALNPLWAVGWRSYVLVVHFALAIVGLFFIIAHLYLCTTGKTFTQTFRSMVDGYHRH